MNTPEAHPILLGHNCHEDPGTFHHPVIDYENLPHVARARTTDLDGNAKLILIHLEHHEDLGWIASRIASDLHPEPFLVYPPGEVPGGLIFEAAAVELCPGEIRFYRAKEDNS